MAAAITNVMAAALTFKIGRAAALTNMATAITNVMAAALTFEIGPAAVLTNMATAITNAGVYIFTRWSNFFPFTPLNFFPKVGL